LGTVKAELNADGMHFCRSTNSVKPQKEVSAQTKLNDS